MLLAGGQQVRLVEAGANLGFGGGANRGAQATAAPLLLICNPDLVVHPGAVAELTKRLESDPSLAVAGPALLNGDGDLSPSARAFPTVGRSAVQAVAGLLRPHGRYADSYRRANAEHAAGRYVDWVTGACMLVRHDAFAESGGFDESYFMYLEELDLAWRLRQHEWRVAYVPTARVTHLGGTSARRRPYRMVVAHHRSLWRFARRTTKGRERLVLPVVGMGLVFRCVVALGRRAVPGSG
jgi:N-acetylglucosaminyl-diphospho-decaprenol L-rhamnosyltransferase